MEPKQPKIKSQSQIIQQKLTSFLKQNEGQISKRVDLTKLNSFILDTSEEDIKLAAQVIRDGGLVGFPTETVYGLGANSFSEKAIKSIFKAKERPENDPIISHVTGYEQAMKLVDTSKEIAGLFKYLADELWPGPLTVVMKANLKVLPMVHTGGTGYIGVRCPNNKIAQALIKYSGCPIGAPSANLFAHVSPSKPIHVFNDLYDKNIYLINGQSTINGIESTVLKIVQSENNALSIMVLRNGSLSPRTIAGILKKSQEFSQVQIFSKKQHYGMEDKSNQESPGQFVKHYSPDIETYLIKFNDELEVDKEKVFDLDLGQSVLIDFADLAVKQKDKVMKYLNLSKEGDMKEAMANLYTMLRTSENIKDAKFVIISCIDEVENECKENELPDFLDTVYDKTFRASSARQISYCLKTGQSQLNNLVKYEQK